MLYTMCSLLNVDSSVNPYRPLKNFLISIAMSQTEQKCSIVLDKQWKLPKMRYKGDKIVSQRIRVDSKPHITELGDVQEEPEFPLRFDKPKPPAKSAMSAKSKPAPSGGLLCHIQGFLSWHHGRPGTAAPCFLVRARQGPIQGQGSQARGCFVEPWRGSTGMQAMEKHAKLSGQMRGCATAERPCPADLDKFARSSVWGSAGCTYKTVQQQRAPLHPGPAAAESCSYAATDAPNTGPPLQESRCLQHHQLFQ